MRKLATALGRFFFACVFLIPAFAGAAQIEIGAGVSRFDHRADGIWYQQGLPHRFDLQSHAFLLGLTGDFSPTLRWHVDAVDLGSSSVDSWDTAADEYYSPSLHQCLSHCDNLAHFIGSGHVYGIATTLEWHTTGEWQIGAEAGPFLYHSRWSIHVPNYFQATGWPETTTAAQTAPWGWMPGGIQRTASGWKPGFVIGVLLRYKSYAVSLRHYFDGLGFQMRYANGAIDGWPPGWTGQTVLMLTHSF